MAIPIPANVRELIDAPNDVHLSTLPEVRPGEGCRYMDPISSKYTGAPFPSGGPDRVCFVIAVEKAAQRTLAFTHSPA